MARLTAHFDGKVFVPHAPVNLPEGSIVEIEVAEGSDASDGSFERLLAAVRSEPHLVPEDVSELERAIEEGKLPVRYDDPFGTE